MEKTNGKKQSLNNLELVKPQQVSQVLIKYVVIKWMVFTVALPLSCAIQDWTEESNSIEKLHEMQIKHLNML